ncbi:MAG: metallophosphoesterase, partial [Myxococcota bacterium]|nr:metallophosphoesterase [Myxococcota bacterium]
MTDERSLRFVHCGDVHLGAGRQVHPARYDDLFRVFEEVCEAAHDADVLLISGDLFDVKEPDVETLARAVAILHELQANAPNLRVIAIEGNHDMRKRARGAYRNTQGVLDVLRSAGLLTLLRPEIDGEGEVDFSDAMVHLPDTDLTVLGLGYSREESVARFDAAMALARGGLSDRRVIVLAHMMLMDSALDTYHGSAQATDLLPIADNVLYVGLGHGHTRVDAQSPLHHGVLYSPGSLEFVHSRNAKKHPDSRGYFRGTITREGVTVSHVPTTRKRPFLHADVVFDPATATSFEGACEQVLARFDTDFGDVLGGDALAPILSVNLSGRIGFSASAFRTSVIQLQLAERFDAIQVFVSRGQLLNE